MEENNNVRFHYIRQEFFQATIATKTEGDWVYMAISRCSPSDNFSKKTGRKYSTSRLMGRLSNLDNLENSPINVRAEDKELLASFLRNPKNSFAACHITEVREVLLSLRELAKVADKAMALDEKALSRNERYFGLF